MRTYIILGALLSAAAIFLFATHSAETADSNGLSRYNIDKSAITVSGVSSGAYFANQMHIAHSAGISGAIIFAGGPFLCAQGSISTATISCMQSTMPVSVSALLTKTKTLEANGQIDALSNVQNSQVYIYSGTKDSVVVQKVAQQGEDLYKQLGAEVFTKYDMASEHAMITDNFGNSCAFRGTPYISNCNYKGAYFGLSHMYGVMNPPTKAVSSNLFQFDQSPYSKVGASMNSKGYIYVPTACKGGESCRLHVVFHGCQQTLDDIGTQYVDSTGYNEVAEANNIIVLYPQAKQNLLYPSNPNGCWDWWGYTEGLVSTLKYATKDALQIQAVWEMVQDLSGIN